MALSVFSNATIASGGRVLNAVLGLFVIALITRTLGPTTYGIYALLLSYGVLLQLLADFGLYLTLVQVIATHPADERRSITHALSLRSSLFLVASAVGVGVAFFIPSVAPFVPPLVVVLGGLFFQSLSQLLLSVYQKYGVAWRATLADLMGRVVQIAAIVTAASFLSTLLGMAAAFTAGTAAAFWAYMQLLPIKRVAYVGFEWKAWKHFLSTSWPLGLMLVLNAIYFRIDTLILSLFRPAAEVGLYGLAYRLVESGLFFPAMLGGLLLPKLSATLGHGDASSARQYLTESIYVLLLLIIPTLFVLVVIPEIIVQVVSGPAYGAAAPLLRILSLALAIMFFGNIFGFALIALQRHKTLVILYGVLVFVNTIGNLLFIPRWGSLAAAWTTVGTEAIAMAVAAVLVFRALPYRLPRSATLPPLLGAASLLLSFVLLRQWATPLLSAAVGLAVYGSVLWGTHSLSRSRLPHLRQA